MGRMNASFRIASWKKEPSPKRASAGTTESIAESTGGACATSALGMRIGMATFCKPNEQSKRLAIRNYA